MTKPTSISRAKPPPFERPADLPPPHVMAFLADPPLLWNERAEDYYTLLLSLGRETAAKDVRDWIGVESIAVTIWRMSQLRRIKAAILRRPRDSSWDRNRVAGNDKEKELAAVEAEADLKQLTELSLIDREIEHCEKQVERLISDNERHRLFKARLEEVVASYSKALPIEPQGQDRVGQTLS